MCAGFSRVNITTALGTNIVGYFHARYASGVLGELEINALALAADCDPFYPHLYRPIVSMEEDNGMLANGDTETESTRVDLGIRIDAEQIF